MAGAIRRAFCWNPIDAGTAIAAVCGMISTGHGLHTGIEIPGLGLADIDLAHHLIRADRVIEINRGLIAQGIYPILFTAWQGFAGGCSVKH